MSRHVIDTMGTVFSLDLRGPVSDDVVDALRRDLAWIDATFSTYRPDSDISRLAAGTVRLPGCAPEVADVLALCADYSRRTDGYFTATPAGRLDPSGLVKGWAIARACRILIEAGVACFAVNGGGDVQTVGAPESGHWRIGVADPHHRDRLAAVVCGADIAVATSGTAERGNHVLNPYTGRPATALSSVTVVGRDIVSADVYATAALAMETLAPQWLTAVDGYEALVINCDGTRWTTRNFSTYIDINDGSPEP